MERPLHKSASDDQPSGPDRKKQHHRERPVDAEQALAPSAGRHSADQRCDRLPALSIVEANEAQASLHATRQEHHLERVLQHEHDQDEPGDQGESGHEFLGKVRLC